jgi:hypothetical protein
MQVTLSVWAADELFDASRSSCRKTGWPKINKLNYALANWGDFVSHLILQEILA